MKKFLILAAVAAATMVLFSACEKEKKTAAPAAETTTVTDNKTVGHYPDPLWPIVPGKLGAAAAPVVVENVISTDRQAMYLQYAKDYNFFESCITLKDYIDEEACDGTVESVANVFQFVVVKEKSADVNVVLIAHAGGKDVTEVKHGFWTEDLPLEETAVKLTFKEAFDRMMKANIVKPHSRQCVLRRPLGPKVCNAQYVFGNRKAQVWVDVVTGDVASTNPAFGGVALGTPLGEWP